MKRCVRLLFVLLLFVGLSLPASAYGEDEETLPPALMEGYETMLNAIPDDVRDKLPEDFASGDAEDLIHGLLANGYVLNITPCKYNDDKYTVMIEIGEIDDSFIPQPTEESNG